MSRALVVAGLLIAATHSAAVEAQVPVWAPAVNATLGRTGAMQPGGVYKFSFPRSDLKVIIGDVQLRPALALGSWLGFLPTGASEAMVMGDLVLTEDEIGPVMKALQAGGVEQSALHNHLRNESPHVMYMHVVATGNAETIARALHSALALTGTPSAAAPALPPAGPIELDTAAIARILGQTGTRNGAVYQVSIPRGETISMHGHVVPPSLGVATAINFQATGGGRAVSTGDFVLLGTEVNRVVRALGSHDIQVTAMHSHMLEESPRLFFMHFWANGDAASIAQGLRSALDETNRSR
ncbi:MAG: DUF1259 domain-containing protein [Gemmatimonadales bacterium]